MSSPIGQISIVHGTAQATSAEGVRALESGSSVFQDDIITTGKNSSLEIRFTDDTVLAQGQDAKLVLDEYVFDPATGQGALNFDLVQGTFRSVTGVIVDNNPEGFELETPLATIGIRGTTTAHTIPPAWAADQTENHVVLVYDGKPVLIIPQADGTTRFIDTSGRKVEVSDIGTSDVKVMTVAEYLYYEQFSSDQLRGEQPTWDTPQDVIDEDPTTNRPVGDGPTSSEGNPANDNLADRNTGDDSGDDDDANADGQDGESLDQTEDDLTLEGNGLEDLFLEGQLMLDDGTTLDVGTTQSALNALQGQTGTGNDSGSSLVTTGNTSTTTTTGSGLQSVSISTGTTTLTAAQVSSGFVATAPSGAGTFSVTVSSSTPPPAGTSVTADFSSFASNQVVNFDASSITDTSAGYFSVTGGGANDTISGTNHNTDGDTIKGGQGNDTLYGYIGNDIIYGGDGDDTIYGNSSGENYGNGSDNDIIYGQAGTDTMYGNEGDDTFVYSGTSEITSSETISGGAGTDSIRVDSDTDFSNLDFDYGVNSIERLNVTAGVKASFSSSQMSNLQSLSIYGADNTLQTVETLSFQASSGSTVSMNNIIENIYTWGSEDTFEALGAAGNETFNGTYLREVFYGYDGDDTFNMDSGNDAAYGGNGNDDFVFGTGFTDADVVDGGSGESDDLFFTSDGSTTYHLTNVTKVETVTLGDAATSMTLAGTFNLVEGQFGVNATALTATSNLTLNASALTESLYLQAGLGADTITGTSGDDSFVFTAGALTAADIVMGGAGNDSLTISGSASNLAGISGIENITINDSRDGTVNLTLLDAQTDDNSAVTIDATAFSDLQSGSALVFDGSAEAGADFTVSGGVMNDTLTTGGGNDSLRGGSGADALTGGAGDDKLIGGSGADTLSGGSGSDTFYYTSLSDGTDSITDFTSGTDSFRFSSSAFSTSWNFLSGGYEGSYDSNGLGFTAGFVYDNLSGNLWYDADGEGQGAETLIATLTGTSTSIASGDITVTSISAEIS